MFSLIAALLGFTGSVAAQYGVVENHYMVNGSVMSDKCKEALPQIKITLRAIDSKGVKHDMEARTDESGNFSINDVELKRFQYYELIAEDTDGKLNKGDFETTRQQIELTSDDFIKGSYQNWNQNYDSKTQYYFGLKFKQDQPCR